MSPATATLGSMLAWMDDAGFILGSYAITLGVIGAYAWRVVRGGRQLADRVDDDRKYWT